VLDLTNNQVLYQKNPNAQLPLASITKVPLALVVAEAMPPDSQITIPFDTAPQGNAQRLAKGDTWKVQDVIDFTLVASSNEGAQILADAANSAVLQKYPEAPHGGVDSAVLWRMNNLAKNLSLSRTYFINVNGLDVSTTEAGAYGSAYDIAELFAYAAEHSPAVFAATTHDSLQLQSIGGQETSAINTDKALDAIPGILMGKTGYTDLAGGNLAVVFSVAPNHPVVAVVLHSSVNGRFDDIKKLVQATQAAILNR
jgi:D-alanyl-D-alanine carboxypeptidase